MASIRNFTIKRPDKEDAADLIPILVALAVWVITSGNSRKSVVYVLPTAAALLAWLLLKGLIYVPR